MSGEENVSKINNSTSSSSSTRISRNESTTATGRSSEAALPGLSSLAAVVVARSKLVPEPELEFELEGPRSAGPGTAAAG